MTQGPEDRIGDVIDRYRIERLLGAGGFGSVYVAQHIHMQRSVALKLLHSQHLQGPKGREMRDRFLREAQAAAAIGHPGIVQVFDSGVAGEDTFVAMELLEGEDLSSYLTREKTVATDSAVAFILRLLEAVGAAHRAGIVHRDLKPANIFLVTKQIGASLDEQPLKLLDFGISKVRGADVEKLTRTGAVMGTPHYMAPEMFLGVSDVDERADLYAVAAILYEMLTGGPTHKAASYEHLVVQVATTPAQSLGAHRSDLSAGLVEAVDRGLKTKPDERFASAEAFAKALTLSDKNSASMTAEDMLGDTALDLPSSVQPTNPADSAPQNPSRIESGALRQPNRNRWLPIAGVLILLGSLGAVWALTSGPDAEETVSALLDTQAMQPAPLAPEEVAEVSESPTTTDSAMLAAPPNMNALNAAPSMTESVNAVVMNAPERAAARESRPRRIQIPCGSGGFQAQAYLAGPQTSIRVTSGSQRGVTESTTVLRQTIATQSRRVLRCYGREPIAIDQRVNFHVGPGGVVSGVDIRRDCSMAPHVRSCLIDVFEAVDFSGVQLGEGDVHIGFSPVG